MKGRRDMRITAFEGVATTCQKMDARKALNPVLVALKIVGGAPYLSTLSLQNVSKKVIFSKIYTGFIVVLVLTLTYFNFASVSYKVSVTNIFVNMSVLLIVASCCACLILAIMNGSQSYMVLAHIFQINDECVDADSRKIEATRRIVRSQVFASMGALLVIHACGIAVHKFSVEENLHTFAVYFSECIIALQNILFTGEVRVLQVFFHAVNSGLEVCMGSVVVQRGTRADIGSGSPTAVARRMIGLHVKLCSVVEMINSAHGLQSVLWAVSSFLAVICSLYFALCMYLDNSKSAVVYVAAGLWGLIHTMRICLTMSACNATSREANRITVIITKLLNQTEDATLCRQLQLYSLQLLHRKIHFTGAGFFILDHVFLYNILGAITTYAVILVQFKLSDVM